MLSEQLRGDPLGEFAASPESLILTDQQSKTIDEMVAPGNLEEVAPAAQKDAKTLFTKFVLDAAGKEADAHISRATNRPRVTEYLALFGLDFADAAGIPYAFCAAGLGWAACEGYCEMDPTIPFGDPPTSAFRKVVPTLNQFYFLPYPSCVKMVERAKAVGNRRNGERHNSAHGRIQHERCRRRQSAERRRSGAEEQGRRAAFRHRIRRHTLATVRIGLREDGTGCLLFQDKRQFIDSEPFP